MRRDPKSSAARQVAHIALGSNLGDRAAHLAAARRRLRQAGVVIVAASEVEETEPVGVTEQPRFLNQVLAVETWLTPEALLDLCQAIEAAEGRAPEHPRWGPRELDLDILLYGDLVVETARLGIPHPELARRDFWLRELLQVAPDAVDPRSGLRLGDAR
jgi:2-amino-4-hydroxy-6-hydroxymethyldihydropteridine diphosphokinase